MDIFAKSNNKEHETLQYIMTIFKITSLDIFDILLYYYTCLCTTFL